MFAKQLEVEHNLHILLSTTNNLKRHREIHTQSAHAFTQIGEILQKIHNLDHTKINLQSPTRETEFYSDRSPIQDLEHEDEQAKFGGGIFKLQAE